MSGNKENLSLHQKANQIVQEKEQRDALQLIEDAHQAERAAEGCGCSQCWKRHESLQYQMEKEAHRLVNNCRDHEEDWIMDWTINNRLDLDDERTTT